MLAAWVLGGRWDFNSWECPVQPDRHSLDSVTGGRPAALPSIDGHTIWANSAALASMLLGRLTSPTQAAQRAEQILRVQNALNALDPIDREILALQHFEQLGRSETAAVLAISPQACAKRYYRAVKRLKEVLAPRPEDRGEI